MSALAIHKVFSFRRGAWAALVFALLAGCRSQQSSAPAIGEAWTGPAVLKLRKDIPLESAASATLKHGERVEIVQRRRRFMKVRASGGREGWTEENTLLNSEEMNAIRELSERAAKMPSHGLATTFDSLNVHTTPSRQSPSFTQLKQGEKVPVLAQVVSPRTPMVRKPLIPPPPKKVKAPKKPKESKYPTLPRPAPPPPPANWLELSKTVLPPAPPPEPPPPVPTDDWTLIRTPSGQAGWVLTRRLFMAIPDEVAQYAEGHRITSYFSLGEVQDGDQKKQNWLWTTSGGGVQDRDFDSFRVFIWSLRRHRYETAYIERKVKGLFPVEVRAVTLTSSGRVPVSTSFPGFSICTEKDDGQRYRRDFAFIVNVVRYAGQGPCSAAPASIWPPPDQQPAKDNTQVAAAPQPAPATAPPSASLLGRMKAALASFTSRFSKKDGEKR